MARTVVFSTLAVALLLAACNTGSTVIPVGHIQQMYVANDGANAIDIYPLNANGSGAPPERIVGAATGLSNPFRIAFDQNGDMFVANQGNNSITEYAPGASGNATPIKTITSSSLKDPGGVAIDAAGNVYVSDVLASAVFIFSAAQSGNVTPTASIVGTNTMLGYPGGIVVDSTGKVYVSHETFAGVLEWNAGHTGNVAPDNSITGISDSYGLQLVNGNLYIGSQSGEVFVFPTSAAGAATPAQLITGGATTLGGDTRAAAADAAGNIYVANWDVVKFSAGATGNVAPIATLTFPTEEEGITVF